MDENKTNEQAANAIVRVEKQAIGKLNPKDEITFATEAAKALMEVVNSKKKKVVIRGQQYLEFEDWQTIARFYNITCGVEETEEVRDSGKIIGYTAKAAVYNAAGIKISGAEAQCYISEDIWAKSPLFQMRSMAQTRASAKALRNVLAWVVVLAGFKPTPAEEMSDGSYKPYGGNVRSYKPAAKQTGSGQAPVNNQPERENIRKLNDLIKKHKRDGETNGQVIERLTGQKVEGTINEGKAKALLELVVPSNL